MYEHNKGGKTSFEALSVYVRFITLRPSEVAMILVNLVNHKKKKKKKKHW